MGNETEKDFNRQQNPGGSTEQSRKNPSQQSGQNPNQQDPSKKNPAQGDDPRRQGNEEGSEQVENRRAS